MIKKPRVTAVVLITFAAMSSALWVKQVAAPAPGEVSKYYHGDAAGANGTKAGNNVSAAAGAAMIARAPGVTVLDASCLAFAVQPIVSIDLTDAGNTTSARIGHRLGPALSKAHDTRELYARDTAMARSLWRTMSLGTNDTPTWSGKMPAAPQPGAL